MYEYVPIADPGCFLTRILRQPSAVGWLLDVKQSQGTTTTEELGLPAHCPGIDEPDPMIPWGRRICLGPGVPGRRVGVITVVPIVRLPRELAAPSTTGQGKPYLSHNGATAISTRGRGSRRFTPDFSSSSFNGATSISDVEEGIAPGLFVANWTCERFARGLADPACRVISSVYTATEPRLEHPRMHTITFDSTPSATGLNPSLDMPP